VDGSPFGEHALPRALSIAQKNNATVHVTLVHVPETYSEGVATYSEHLERTIKDQEQEYLNALHGRLTKVSQARVQIHHREGLVSETLEEEVSQCGIDLVVMSTHGWGYFSRAILGSVADRLMRHLHVPMLLIHPPEGPADLKPAASLRRILVPLDGSALAEAILEPAQELGSLSQAEFRLLRVLHQPHHITHFSGKAPAADQQFLEQIKAEAARYLDKVAQGLRGQSLTTHVAVKASPAAAILEEARAADCDLIALATHGLGGLQRLLFGSVADKVIRSAAFPVLVQHIQQ